MPFVGVFAAAVRPPAATIRDPTQLLDVDVDELTGPGRGDPSDHPPGGWIHRAELVQALTDQHPMHRRGMHLHDARDTRRPQLGLSAQPLDPPLNIAWCALRAPMRSARPIPQPGVSLRPPPPPPLVR